MNGKYHATSSTCPHYNAPLIKGTLSSDGFVKCAWHGACFQVATGDIENGPSLDALISHKLTIQGDDILIHSSGNEFDANHLLSSSTVPKVVCVEKRVVIVGGGAAAATTVESLRRHGFLGEIRMISKEGHYPIDRYLQEWFELLT